MSVLPKVRCQFGEAAAGRSPIFFVKTAAEKTPFRVSRHDKIEAIDMSGEEISADEVERALVEAGTRAERVNEANHTDPPAEKETSPFVHLIPEMKSEICSFLSDSDKFELLKSTKREKLELLKSTGLPRKENYRYFLHKSLHSGIRSDGDIHAAVNAWCEDPVAAEIKYGHISRWDTSLVTDTRELFKDKTNFNDDISQWNVSNVTNMQSMFSGASTFNQPLEHECRQCD
jgi:surface protein